MNSDITISNNIISNNHAHGGDNSTTIASGGNGYGGGIYARNGNITITGNIIKENSACGGWSLYAWGGNGYGGGIYVTGVLSCTITDNLIQDNRVDIGGGTYGSGDEALGGGIYAGGMNILIERHTIISNTADGVTTGQGGGIYAAACTMKNNFILSNEAGAQAGGLYCFRAVLVNNTIAGNTAPDGAAVMGVNGELINNIFYGNGPDKIISGVMGAIQHNNFYMNTGTLYYDGVTSFTSVAHMDTALTYSLNNISCDPRFVGGIDYHILSTSCCINAGTSYSAPSDDINGDTRPHDGGYDIGADECTSARVPVFDTVYILIAVFISVLLSGYLKA